MTQPINPDLQVQGQLSDNERLKKDSQLLRGTITKDLKDEITGGFTGDNFMLIRFHGMYQQDDRDIRPERAQQKLEPLHNVMLRAGCRAALSSRNNGWRLTSLQRITPSMAVFA